LALLNWSASYSIGVAVLDSEHRHLFDLLNQLYDSIIDGSVSDENTRGILDKVLDFAVRHCDHEEEMLAQANYPGLADVSHQHEYLRDKMGDFQRKLSRHGCVSTELANFLMEWVLQHILKEDKKCGAFLNTVGIY
jgi:hemerythrin-like metal-binding protein